MTLFYGIYGSASHSLALNAPVAFLGLFDQGKLLPRGLKSPFGLLPTRLRRNMAR